MKKYLLLLSLFFFYATADGTLAGGRPNAFSEGQNAFAGIVNPANAVWIADRFDVGAYWFNQKTSLTNQDNNPLFPPGKIDLNYKVKTLFTADVAIHKQFKLEIGSEEFETSVSLATYSLPTYSKLRTKMPFKVTGTTPLYILNKTDAISAVFSFKLNSCHSVGASIDYLYLSHDRRGFQIADNPLRSVSPGHVTNNGTDHSHGFGLSAGWRWRITEKLDFGTAWSRKSPCGQFRKYRGYEPHHANNYTSQIVGAGLSYRFTSRLAGRIEAIWMNLGNLPGANNNVLPNGMLNLHKRGSNKSPGPGLNDATFINVGMGYLVNPLVSVGMSYSRRIKLARKSPLIISHSYMIGTIYDLLAVAANFTHCAHNVFVGFSYGFKNKVTGLLPAQAGGGTFVGERQTASVSISYGYKY